MITISDGILTIPEGERFVGFSGDNLHTQKKFFIRSTPESGWLYRLYLTFDDGRHNFFTLPKEEVKEGTFLIWNIEEGHILKSGLVKAQIKAFSQENEVYHTTSDVFVAGKSAEEDEEFLNSNSEFLSLEKRLNELYGKMDAASAKMPYVGSNGNWFTYDVNSGTYKDSGASAIVSLEGVKISPDTLDREYWQKLERVSVTGYDYFDSILSEQNAVNTIYRVEFSGLSPIKSLVGEGSFVAVVSFNQDALLLLNIANGDRWLYEKGSNTLTKPEVYIKNNTVTPEMLDRKYWEYFKSSFVETAHGLLGMLSEQQIMRVKALKDSALYSQLGDNEAVAIKTENGFLLIDLVSAKTYKFDPMGGLEEIRKIADGDINSEYLFSEDMRAKFLSLSVSKVTVEDFTVEWFNKQTVPGIYQVRTNKGENCVLIVLKPNTDYHLMQIRLSHNKFEYRSCETDVANNYFSDCWTEWFDFTGSEYVKEKLKDIEARLNGVEMTSWKAVQDIVRSGRAAEIFSVGDKFVCEHSEYGLLEWMVIGIDHDTPADESLTHSMTLRLDTPIKAPQYDAPEALFFVTKETSFPAKFFTVEDKTVNFSKELPVGAVLVFPYYNYTNITDTPLYVYATPDDTEPMMTLAVSEGAGMGPPLTSYANQNNIYRARYGSNNWAESAMRQFLNSAADAGKVWSPQNAFDRPPKWSADTAGFLKGMDKDFVDVIGEVKKLTLSVALDNGVNEAVESTEKFFLLSPVEVYAGDYRTGEIADGKPYAYYSENSSNTGATIKADTNRIVYYNGSVARAFLRSPLHNKTEEVCYINAAGEVNAVDANADYSSNSIVLTPCCCIV